MRTFAILFMLIATMASKRSMANDGTAVTPEVLQSFQSRFAAAKEADWSVTADLYKVQFILNGQHITAFYKSDGTVAALTRNIITEQLPLALQTTLKNEYKSYWVSALFELSNDEGTQYYVTLEDADTKLVFKSSASMWSLFQKERKN